MCASGAKGRAIRLWKVFTGETLAPLEGHSYGVNSAARILMNFDVQNSKMQELVNDTI